MRAFHNDPAVKEKYLNRVKLHALADNLIQGTGWDDGKGCAVGCTLEAYDHKLYPGELGLPVWLAHLEDALFEGMPTDIAKTWPQRFLEAIPVGADVENVQWKLAIWRHEKQLISLKDNKHEYAAQCGNAIRSVIDYCKLQLTNDKSAAESAWSAAAESAAWSAAESAAWSAAESAWSAAAESAAWSARSAACSAAESAAWSAAAAARSAAESAWSAAAESAAWSARSAACSAAESARSAAAAWSAAYVEESEMLLKLLSKCK